MLTHPSILLSKKYKNHYGKSCSLRFQQSLVDVYVKFYIATSAGYDYFINRQAALKITHLLKNQMRVADPRIVSLEDSILQGQSPGLTEVQVLCLILSFKGSHKRPTAYCNFFAYIQ